MHRANPFIVVVVVVVVVVQLLLFVSLRRDSLPSRWSRSIDRSINSRANRMDLKEMLTWHSDAFSRSTFSLSQKKRPLDQQRQNVKKSSFENHSPSWSRRRRPSSSSSRGPRKQFRDKHTRPFIILKEKKRALFVYKSRFQTKPIKVFFWKKTQKKTSVFLSR